MLYLLPNLLFKEANIEEFFPLKMKEAVESLEGLIAESEKSARAFLRKFISHEKMQTIPIYLFNEHTKKEELVELFPLIQKKKIGLISDLGLPILADPGYKLVAFARKNGIEVKAFAGPSSIVFAMMLSGFSMQKFCFHGYLPREKELLISELKKIEEDSFKATQIFIEAPYRTISLKETLVNCLKPFTFFCIAQNLTTDSEKIYVDSIKNWKLKKFEVRDVPSVFLLSQNEEILSLD